MGQTRPLVGAAGRDTGRCSLSFGWTSTAAAHTAGVTTLCAFQDLEPIPVPATSPIPFAALPLLNVVDHKVKRCLRLYLDPVAVGGLHLIDGHGKERRSSSTALGMVRMVGGRGGRDGTGSCSRRPFAACISNTATVLMLMPVAAAVLSSERESLRIPLLLGIAYSASIGGLGTPVGTPPNVIFIGQYEELVGQEMGFIEWMKIGIPAVVIMLPLAWLWLTRNIRESQPVTLPPSGPWSLAEKRVLWVFGFTALAWVTRGHPMGGWSHWLHIPGAGDSTVALLSVVALFDSRWPQRSNVGLGNRQSHSLGIVTVFGGGIAIAKAFDSSGLAQALGDFWRMIWELQLAGGRHDRHPLFYSHLSHRNHIQYSDNHASDAGSLCCGGVRGPGPRSPHDPGHTLCQLCFHATGCHGSQRGRLRNRSRHDSPDGTGGTRFES